MAWIENVDIPFEKSGRITLHPLGDFQFDSESCDRKMVKYAVQEVCDDPTGGMSIFLGDVEDSDRPSTRMLRKGTFAGREEVLDADGKQYLYYLDKEIIPLLMPLTKTKFGIIGMLAGHHWKQLTPSLNSVQYMCNQLTAKSDRKVPYLGQMSSWVRFLFRPKNSNNSTLKVGHIQHGEGGGNTLASAINKLELASRGFEADFYIRAHDCKLIGAKFDKLYTKSSATPQIMSKTIALLNVGSATRGYNLTTEKLDYVEAKMMRPTTLGWGKIHFDIRKSYTHEDPQQSYRVNIGIEI